MRLPGPDNSDADSSVAKDREKRLAQIVDEAISAGAEFDAARLCDRYPEYSEQIRELQPYIQALISFGDGAGTGVPESDRTREFSQRTLGDFQLIREIGRGGMGVVYEAQQLSLNRRVAVKVLPFASLLSADQMRRFDIEAQAAASLHHPNIVNAFFVGCDRGTHFYAMRFIDGRNLAEIISELARDQARTDSGRPHLPGKVATAAHASDFDVASVEQERTQDQHDGSTARLTDLKTGDASQRRQYYLSLAKLGYEAASALDYAHTMGIVHRDVKPSNLIVDNTGRLWLTDFGVAACQSNSTLTVSGDLLGTLRYTCPEYVVGSSPVGRADPRMDIYSLGATLYELLALRPAVAGVTRAQILANLTERECLPPTRFDRRVPLDFSNIVMKAVAKRPADRYRSAAEMRDDLRCFLEHRPVRARRISAAQRVVRWVRRRPLQATLVLTTLLCVSALTIGGPFAAIKYRSAREKLLGQNYALSISAAYRSWNDRHALEAMTHLASVSTPEYARLRGFEWKHLNGRLKQALDIPSLNHPAPVCSALFFDDGKQIVTGCKDGLVRFWDRETHGMLREHLQMAPVTALDLSKDERMLVTVSGRWLRLWSPATMEQLCELELPTPGCRAIHFSPDQSLIAVGLHGTPDRSIAVWRLVQGEDRIRLVPLGETQTHPSAVRLEFAPDQKTLVTCSDFGGAHIWQIDADHGLSYLRRVPTRTNVVGDIAFSEDGGLLVTVGESIELWRTSDWSREALLADRTVCWRVCFTPDNQHIVTAGVDPTRLWNLQSQRLVRTYPRVHTQLHSLKLSPDGEFQMSASREGIVRWAPLFDSHSSVSEAVPESVWRSMVPCATDELDAGSRKVLISISPRSSKFDRFTPRLELVDLDTRERTTLESGVRGYLGMTVCPSRPQIVAVGGSRIDVWNVRTQSKIWTPPIEFNGYLSAVAFSRSGNLLAVAGADGPLFQDLLLEVWDMQNRRCAFRRTDVNAFSLAITRDDRFLVAAGGQFDGGVCEVIEIATGKTVRKLPVHRTLATSPRFSQSGKRLVCGDWLGGFRVWDWSDKRIVLDVPRILREGAWGTFLGDDRTIAIPVEFEIEIWRIDLGRRIASIPMRRETDLVTMVDNSLIALGCDGRLMIWTEDGDYDEIGPSESSPRSGDARPMTNE